MVLTHVREIAVDRVRRRIYHALRGDENPCHAGLSITANSERTHAARADCCSFPIAANAYSIRCMPGLYEVEIEPEVRSWLARLSNRDFGGSTSSSACSPSTPKISASLTPVISVARSGNCGSTCYASSPGSLTGWLPVGG